MNNTTKTESKTTKATSKKANTEAKKTTAKTPEFTLTSFINEQPKINRVRRTGSNWEHFTSRKSFFMKNADILYDADGCETAIRKSLSALLYTGNIFQNLTNSQIILIEIKPTKDAVGVERCVLAVNLETGAAKKFITEPNDTQPLVTKAKIAIEKGEF